MTGRKHLDWAAMMRVGIGELSLPPEVFWRLSPAELLLLLGDGGPAPMGRPALEALSARFPDTRHRTEQEVGNDTI